MTKAKEGSNRIIGRTNDTERRFGVWASGKVTQKELLKPTHVYWIIQRDGLHGVSVISSMLHIHSDTPVCTHAHITNSSRRMCQTCSKVFIYYCNVGAQRQAHSPRRGSILFATSPYTQLLFYLTSLSSISCSFHIPYSTTTHSSACCVWMMWGHNRGLMKHMQLRNYRKSVIASKQ